MSEKSPPGHNDLILEGCVMPSADVMPRGHPVIRDAFPDHIPPRYTPHLGAGGSAAGVGRSSLSLSD